MRIIASKKWVWMTTPIAIMYLAYELFTPSEPARQEPTVTAQTRSASQITAHWLPPTTTGREPKVPSTTRPDNPGKAPDSFDEGQAELHRYQRAAGCVNSTSSQLDMSRSGRVVPHDRADAIKAACDGVTPVEIRDRLTHLERAAALGTPEAAFLFGAAGPFGDRSALQTRPDDPLVREWQVKALHYFDVALEHGDLSLLNDIGISYGGGLIMPPDSEKSLVYAVAAKELGTLNPTYGENWMSVLEYVNGPEKVAKATAEGKELAAKFRRK